LYVLLKDIEEEEEEAWFLYSGCSNDMCGDITMFHNLDENFHDSEEEDAWFLYSGCSNDMCGDITMFHNLDENFHDSVKYRNNSKMKVMGKGGVKLSLDEVNIVVTEIYYIIEL